MPRSSCRSWFPVILSAVAALWLSSLSLLAHEFHISSAELEYNPESQRYEVALKLNMLDFQPLLSWINNPQVPSHTHKHAAATWPKKDNSLAEVSESEQRLLEKYCSEHFYISPASPQRQAGENATTASSNNNNNLPQTAKSQLLWQGCEVESAAVWLYFELLPPEGDGPFFLTNTVLFGLNKGQTNSVVLKIKGQRTALKTDHARIQVALPPVR